MSRVELRDMLPGGLGNYQFAINHDEEDAFGTTLAVEKTASTSGVSFIRQIGDASMSPLTIKGTILQRAQLQKLYLYHGACMGTDGLPKRTLIFVDQLGSEFEVLILSFLPKRERLADNPRGATPDERLVKWTYTLSMDIVRTLGNWP